ncbi:hypothetical protein GC098_37780 [Paenibacillus sp. LMG 31458]|jgi:hypothetical protein|uniref:Uncharacterized protein n=2 Tax=Paenibacillus TaxID=44249 RepID=A0ABX1Z509_9BACL|nr:MULTISPECIES: hypothetical protein [Paenibacillus]NOU77047.1 hypothetical protein [Paenibacillus phytorum]NOU88465.1 hypothetical protein [Paenibacillus germinis]
MTQPDSSLQSQNPISSAQNSVDNVHAAVSRAMSHPTPQTKEEAQNSITHAERALEQATDQSDSPAVQQAVQSLNDEKARLQSNQ